MDPFYWVLLVALVIAAFVIGGVAVWMMMKRGSGHRLKERFGPEYDRIAKETGDTRKAEHELLRREHRVAPGPEVEATLAELDYLEKNIGPTGMLALSPFLSASARESWQVHLLTAR